MSLFTQYNYQNTNVIVILGAKPINSVNLGHVHAHAHTQFNPYSTIKSQLTPQAQIKTLLFVAFIFICVTHIHKGPNMELGGAHL